MGGEIMENTCRSNENLHYLDSWNKHCGGSSWEFMSRTLTLFGSGALSLAGVGAMAGGGPVGMTFGASLIFKSGNDTYEALTGKRSLAREAAGDPLYDAIDVALFGYGFFRRVPKINYLGNPKRDFFVKDPQTYESAFKQFSVIESIHEGANISAMSVNGYEKYRDRLIIENSWDMHLKRLEQSND
jgi:hypothetical protein